MAADLGAVANRLFDDFLAPLVLGGEVKPGRPIGARAALAMGRERVLTDIDKVAHVELVRTRVARRLVPIDRVQGLTEAEWALAATLHDLVQTAHPGFDGTFRRRAPHRLLELAHGTLERVPAPVSVGEALARHTLFSRMFQLARTDTVVRWWVGSRTFLGESPPPRLSAWPELRRVHVETSDKALMDLPAAGGAVDSLQFARAMTRFLAKSPLTDLATCHRAAPLFSWGSESLGLVATAPGRALASRALALTPKGGCDAALGRATRALVLGRAWPALSVVLDLLADRALLDAELAGGAGEGPPAAQDPREDAGFARSAGALVACQKLRSPESGFTESDRARLLGRLDVLARAPAAVALAADLSGQAEPAADPPQ